MGYWLASSSPVLRRPEAFGLCVVVALAAAAVQELRLSVAQQRFVAVTHVLATPVGVDNQDRRGWLGE